MFVSIALSALCSALEATLLSTPLSYITGLEEQGVKGAGRLKKLKQNPDRPISAILCLNTIANTVGASIVGSLVYEVYGDALVGIFSTVFSWHPGTCSPSLSVVSKIYNLSLIFLINLMLLVFGLLYFCLQRKSPSHSEVRRALS